MSLFKPQHTINTFLVVLCLALGVLPSLAWGEEADETLGLFSAWQEEASTSSRAPKPLSQTAENVTVVTAPEIEALNAHTLADVLDTIPGIQVQHNGGPGVSAYTFIQSIDFIHTQVFVDGVSITNLGSGFSDTSLIPAHIIERIEIVKGAASSAWGQALGGVINVITKSPERGRTIGGAATASIGEQTTADTSLELSGTGNRFGYYLSGSYLGSDGLFSNTQINSNRAYAKLTYDLPNHGQIWATYFSTRADMGDLYAVPYDLKERQEKRFTVGSVGLRYPIGERLELEIMGHHSFNRNDASYFNISDGATWSFQTGLPTGIVKEQVSGASAKLVWRGDDNLLVVGSDYNHLEQYNNSSDGSTVSPFNRKVERWGVFLNDTLTLGPMSLTPGVRVDHTQTAGDQFSPALGATWQLTDSTLLRAYTARGYGLPVLGLTDSPSVKIWTTQVGAESSAIPYVWVKGTLFRNQTWGDTVKQHMALGAELEARTTPIWNTSLGAGYTFTDTTRTSDGNEVNDFARHTVQVALRYNDKTYRGVLTGRHVFWNSRPDENGRYGGLTWDLHLGAVLFKREQNSLELFFSGHNLFNASQYETYLIPNTGRWFEGGMRVRF
ncbi:TonB-dependent receptor plug domain-containing protein [Oryzomonas japonica]|nr:TonB-dependent receptor [Oryzomonas japonica]